MLRQTDSPYTPSLICLNQNLDGPFNVLENITTMVLRLTYAVVTPLREAPRCKRLVMNMLKSERGNASCSVAQVRRHLLEVTQLTSCDVPGQMNNAPEKTRARN
jgi:hypothetical protein